jgi:hypothetical protein
MLRTAVPIDVLDNIREITRFREISDIGKMHVLVLFDSQNNNGFYQVSIVGQI